jgi:excinuclease ABC subunit B
MEGARAPVRGRKGERQRRGREEAKTYARLSPEQASARLQQLEKRMYQHARDLEFEQAARLRDEINDLKQRGMGLPKRAAQTV